MLVFSTQLCELLPLEPSLWFTSPPLPLSLCQSTVYTKVYTDSVRVGGVGGWGVLSLIFLRMYAKKYGTSALFFEEVQFFNADVAQLEGFTYCHCQFTKKN
jgi:hypothetical protein